MIADVQHRDLFCHERYDDFNVLLGFGDGQIKQLDVRQPQSVSVTFARPPRAIDDARELSHSKLTVFLSACVRV